MSAKKLPKVTNAMYEQQMAHLPAKDVDGLIDLIEKRVKPKKFAVILHDKDIDTNGQPVVPHIHAMLSFTNARHITSIAKLLNDTPQQIQKWDEKAKNGFSYLIHATKDAINKHQYDVSEVRANFDYAAEIQSITQQVAKAQKLTASNMLLDLLYSGNISKEEVEKRLSGSQYGRIKRQINDVWAKRLQTLAKEWQKEMLEQGKSVSVIWIFGVTGTGKTRFAKDYAKKSGQDFYVSGSSRDVFQSYQGQHTMILDELRPRVLQYHDILRILDPFGSDSQIMLPSRFKDKGLAADLIVITTPYNPYSFYKEQLGLDTDVDVDKSVDSFDQLLRRIKLTIKMTDKELCVAEYDRNTREYIPVQATVKKNTFSSSNNPAPTSNSVDIYNSMFD